MALMPLCATAQIRNKAKAAKTIKKTASEQLSAEAKIMYEEMLPNTQRLFIIDSVVVDKSKAIEAIPLPADYGSFVPYSKFFSGKKDNGTYVYVNGFGNKCFFAESDTTGASKIYSADNIGGAWAKPQAISGIGDGFKNIEYPYMSADGSTLYFSAESSDGLGRHDIFVAGYNAENGTFYKPENIGLPLNSSADDFIYIDDDNDSLAWFATTRRQPAGKACIYTIKTSGIRQNYNMENYDEKKMRSLAAITSIKDTWPNAGSRNKALAVLAKIKRNSANEKHNSRTIFVINDNISYNSIDDFRSETNKKRFEEIENMRQKANAIGKSLELDRTSYHNSKGTQRNTLAATIMQKETQLERLSQNIKEAEKKVRNSEIMLIEQ